MVVFIFSKEAKKSIMDLPVEVQERIQQKLFLLKSHSDIFSILKPIHERKPVTHRLRVGNYRLVLELSLSYPQYSHATVFRVADIGHRKDIYS
ncbi:MAG: hypothetical protein NTX63_05255 [Candidatus Peregrinibacteria bacterium]|nr:hypothetical protein [Candidatus Peregrinibacteria bacterium]